MTHTALLVFGAALLLTGVRPSPRVGVACACLAAGCFVALFGV